jgi:hypothetical protein
MKTVESKEYSVRVEGLELNKIFKSSNRYRINQNTYKYFFKTQKGADNFAQRLNNFCLEEYGVEFNRNGL